MTCSWGCRSSLLSFVKSLYSGEIIENSRKIIYPYELDIFLPELNFAIEFNGTYHHADPRFYGVDTMIYYKLAEEVWQRDRIKAGRCKKLGINLFVVWEYDWENNRNKIENELSRLLGMTD